MSLRKQEAPLSPMVYHPRSGNFQLGSASHRVPLTAMCLTKFDVKKGNTVLWTTSLAPEHKLHNIEFKTLPAGIHESEQDWVNFVLPKEDGEFYYGVALFSQNGLRLVEEEQSHGVDRSRVEMYSLAVITDPQFRLDAMAESKYYRWKPNMFICANEYKEDLAQLMEQWLKSKSLEVLEHYFSYNKYQPDLGSPLLMRKWPGSSTLTGGSYEDYAQGSKDDAETFKPSKSWLYLLPEIIEQLGPSIFTLWKACLLRQRILVVNEHGQSFERTNALTYCLSVLSLIPLQLERKLAHANMPLQTLYTIGIADLDHLTDMVSDALHKSDPDGPHLPSFIACTSDEILAERGELFDMVVKLSNYHGVKVYAHGTEVRATPHEWESFQYLSANFLYREYSEVEMNGYMKNVESLSWSQYIIDALYWWSTAGYLQPPYHNTSNLLANCDRVDEKNEVEIVLGIVEYFHSKITLLYEKLHEIITDPDADASDRIAVPSLFLAECGLDCFSFQDHEFLKTLCAQWFNVHIEIRVADFNVFC
ncbi:ABR061Cp [Eremothecium gossypii ATCC 10895]|uniref:ABR061Cp n=1 Tax=Eremothecium gossypii (strain ATCC 10895 / CBS 109.51 / FGSC 9923 / NRRL Y-1056) TaxID=284811 RepID=Q75DG5_EREGS|nr:ABR061Cp [Eremothecium gossypii ATCC 10895]AAS50831.2 ABR061Cp [Eremothecium gossypii ATCC 10895]AEY95120.1 FABR061Cp [Eremothecium gossypii FDAG1]